MSVLSVARTTDFDINGLGDHMNWQAHAWQPLTSNNSTSTYTSRFKVAWSPEALYVLFDCQDQWLSCSGLPDGADLYTEDVVEFFLWPDESMPVYFEYEASPLGAELALLVVNNGDEFMGWQAWHYEGPRRCQLRCSVLGGEAAPHASVDSWRAEIRLPFALLKGLGNGQPQAGSRWRANFYRIDYDGQKPQHWNWSDVNLHSRGFHDIHNFGTLLFV